MQTTIDFGARQLQGLSRKGPLVTRNQRWRPRHYELKHAALLAFIRL